MPRRGSSSGVFWFVLTILGASVFAGSVAAWVTRYNVTSRVGKAAGDRQQEAGAARPTAQAISPRSLEKLSRPQLEEEVVRLNQAVVERDQQLDELKIQLKLVTEGSRASR